MSATGAWSVSFVWSLHSLCKVPQSPSLQVLTGDSYVYTKPIVRSCRLHEIDNTLKTNVSANLKKKKKTEEEGIDYKLITLL